MTLDDESSVYVGGLAYDSTEDMLQKAFEEFGEIVSIKIVYDRDSGQSRGFGFVTFTSPRAASKAISGMDGNLLSGRTVRVNEVKKHGGKSLGRENSFRDRGDKDRDHRDNRDREHGRGRRFSPQRNRRALPAQGRSGRGRSPMHNRSPLHNRSPMHNRSPIHQRSRSPRAARSPSRNSSSGGRVRARSSPSPLRSSPRSSDRNMNRSEDTGHRQPKISSRIAKDKNSDTAKVREELEQAMQSRQELEDKVAALTNAIGNAEETIFSLKAKSQELEASLTNALALSAHRQSQLRKLQKGVLQVKESSERLQRSERDLKALMAAAMVDLETVEGENEDGRILGNGSHHDLDRRVDGAAD